MRVPNAGRLVVRPRFEISVISATSEKRVFGKCIITSGGGAMEASATGAVVVGDALDSDVLDHLQRDVTSFIQAFDDGYEPPSRPGSLTSGEHL